jgi:hypothetical protein
MRSGWLWVPSIETQDRRHPNQFMTSAVMLGCHHASTQMTCPEETTPKNPGTLDGLSINRYEKGSYR